MLRLMYGMDSTPSMPNDPPLFAATSDIVTMNNHCFDLLLHVTGASELELSQGIAAARAVMHSAGVSAPEAELSYRLAVRWASGDGPRSTMPTMTQQWAADAWARAERTAIAICCEGWKQIPRDAALELQIDTAPVRRIEASASAAFK
jgi:hypothetical protein